MGICVTLPGVFFVIVCGMCSSGLEKKDDILVLFGKYFRHQLFWLNSVSTLEGFYTVPGFLFRARFFSHLLTMFNG